MKKTSRFFTNCISIYIILNLKEKKVKKRNDSKSYVEIKIQPHHVFNFTNFVKNTLNSMMMKKT